MERVMQGTPQTVALGRVYQERNEIILPALLFRTDVLIVEK